MRRVAATLNRYMKRQGHGVEHRSWLLTNNVRGARSAKYMTQQTLALKTGISRYTLSRIENGHQEPLISHCIVISEALGVAVESLFKVRPAPAAPWRKDPWQTTLFDKKYWTRRPRT